MRRILLTLELARASGKDAGNARMRKDGRAKWNRADYNHAVETTAKLMRHIGTLEAAIAREMTRG